MVYSYGYSLDRDGTCHLDQPSDLSGVEPFLGPLQNNGGPTETHALPETSPAVNAGNCSATVATTDQRGVYRPQGGECDMGAYEYTWPFVYLPIILRP